MIHFRTFKCKNCGKKVDLVHIHLSTGLPLCSECDGELIDTGSERYDVQWAIYVGIHKVYSWEGYL